MSEEVITLLAEGEMTEEEWERTRLQRRKRNAINNIYEQLQFETAIGEGRWYEFTDEEGAKKAQISILANLNRRARIRKKNQDWKVSIAREGARLYVYKAPYVEFRQNKFRVYFMEREEAIRFFEFMGEERPLGRYVWIAWKEEGEP